ncbi:MAG: hypothetical protein ACXV5F_02530 [Halobacteriota archaeon]
MNDQEGKGANRKLLGVVIVAAVLAAEGGFHCGVGSCFDDGNLNDDDDKRNRTSARLQVKRRREKRTEYRGNKALTVLLSLVKLLQYLIK